tara:strand:+ start:9583 stop:11514 length:1932 start_codon:yes stop_codon:yes gene_type:complete
MRNYYKEKKQISLIFFSFFLFFLIVLIKAFYIQVVNKEKLLKYSKKQILREFKIYPNRGNIFDREGNSLAINTQTYSIFTIPKNVKEGINSYIRLSEIVPNLSLKTIQRKIYKRKRYTWLARKISLTDKQVIKIREIKGIYIEAVPKRFYPNQSLLSQTLGFVGLDNKGLSGLEYVFDDKLRGKAKVIKYVKDAKGRPLKFESIDSEDTAKSLYLTIDKDLQSMAEKALKEAIIKSKALKGGVGVMDAKTGEILAIANYPTFDPNAIQNRSLKNTKLSFISDPFEPGSVFKTFTVASAFENKIAMPDTNFYCERGSLKIGEHIIREADLEKKYEWLSVSEILKYSSNIGTTKIAFDLTFPKLRKTLVDLSIGQKTGVEMPGESRGIFTSKVNITPLSLSNISFGQGVATTGVQILSAYSTIANGGYLVKPTIVKKWEGERKDVGKDKTRVLTQKTAEFLTDILIKAVEDGTGSQARIPYFKIAGKTSTAQRPDKEGGYSGYIPGFVGFPVNVKDRFVIYVYIEKPEGENYYGNRVAAPVFKKIAHYYLYKNKDFDDLAFEEGINTKVFKSMVIEKQPTRLIGKKYVPDFIGLDKISVSKLASQLKVKVLHKGIGLVISQKPSPGKEFAGRRFVELIYSPPKYE